MKGKFAELSKTFRGNGELRERLEEAVKNNIIHPLIEEGEKLLYRGPNYFLSVEKVEDGYHAVKVLAEGAPLNEPYLRKIIGRTVN